MKKFALFSMLAFLLLVLVRCEKEQLLSGTEYPDALVTQRANATVPFKGIYTTHPVPISTDEDGTMIFEIPSEGTATHLGKSTWFSLSTVYFVTTTPPPWNQDGTSIFTAADGSTLVGAFEGTTAPLEDSPFSGSGTYWIDYGTGRFEGATGGGTYWYKAAPDLSSAQLEFTGILTKL